MRKPVALISGANGEIGHGLIEFFVRQGKKEVVALDINPFDDRLAGCCTATIVGDILDENLLERLVSEYEIQEIYHLAALLSTRAEYTPVQAHRVNVNGTLNLLQLAVEQARWQQGVPVKFLFPSSIAAYGLPDRETKNRAGRVRETDYNFPSTMYGCNKLYCEQLGRYFTFHFRQLSAEKASGVDFRALRFPGLISAVTVPSGGTSDYAPEMIHAAAKGESYACFVDEGARIPFMAMPDGVKALVMLADAPAEKLTQRVYNLAAFSVTAGELRDRVLKAFPDARITFVPDVPRAGIVDTWPADVDDAPARRDWGWSPDYDADRAFDEYLIPSISRYYQKP